MSTWDVLSRQVQDRVRFMHKDKGYVTFTWLRKYGDNSIDEKQLPSIRMSFYPNYADDHRDMRSLEFTLGGHGIGQNSEVGDVLRVLQRLMAEGLWDRAVERLYAQPDLLIDWDNPTGGSEEDNG